MEELKSLDQILSELKGGDIANQGIQKIAPNTGKQPGLIQDIQYDIPTSAVYDRLSDGTYIPMFENYKGAIGNEDRLAQQQAWYEQAGYGLLKNIRKAGNYAIDSVAGTVYGAMSALTNWDFEKLYDNDFSNTIDDWNKQLDYKLPNYYSDEQKSQSFLRSTLTTNFWFNDVAGGLAFVAGALLPEIVKGYFTGGQSIPLALAKYGTKATFKSGDDILKAVTKEGIENSGKSSVLGSGANIFEQTKEFNTFEKGTNMLRAFQRANFIKTSGDALSTGLFLARTSNFEAGMEARHNFKQAMSEYFETFEEKNGRQPTFEEMTSFAEQARIASNGVYGANMSILMLSNAAMFGKTFGIGATKAVKNPINRFIGLSATRSATGELTLATATRAQKVAGTLYKTLSKPAIEGLYEEGFQGVAGRTMQNYLRSKYDPEQQSGYSTWAALSDAFSEQYGSKEGWKEMGIGFIIGFAGGTMQGHGFEGLGKNSRRAAEAKLSEDIDIANSGVETLRNVNRASTIKNFRNIIESGAMDFKSTSAENAMMNVEFIKSQEHLKSRSEIQTDFNTVIDNMELDSKTLDEIGPENLEVYKNSLKEEFAQNLQDYNFARKTVSSLGLDKKILSAGNMYEVAHALTMQIVVGKDALRSAKNIADQISSLTGNEGIFDYMHFYSNLDSRKKEAVSSLRYKKRKLKQLEKLAVDYGQISAGAQIESRLKDDKESASKKYLESAEKLVLTQQEITRLRQEIENLNESLNEDLRTANFDIDGSVITDRMGVQDVLTAIEELDKLDAYKEALRRNNRGYEAESLDYLINQFKFFSDTHRELNNTTRRMLSSNFFSDKEGQSMIDSIIGDKYKMSDDFKRIIEENDELIDRSLGLTGQFRGKETVTEYIERAIEQNPDLSEREKFNLESILRLQLGVEAMERQLEIITNVKEDVSAVEESGNSPLEGDTVSLRYKLNIEENGLDGIDILNKTIDTILSQIDYLRASSSTNAQQKESQKYREALNSLERKSIPDEYLPGDYRKVQDLATRIRRGEKTTSPEDIELAKNYPDLLEVLIPEDLLAKIVSQSIENNEVNLKQSVIQILNSSIDVQLNTPKFRIIDSQEFLRLNELTRKKELSGLSVEEEDELSILEDDINQWLMITGTVAEGLRLSDLIRQKVILEDTFIQPVVDVSTPVSQDILDGVDFGDRIGGANYSLGQSYDAVTAIGDSKTGSIAISGITPDSLIEEVGFDFEFSMNERGNILITPEVQKRINEESNISILPTNRDLTTNYSIVIKHGQDINGNPKSFPLKSNYSDDFTQSQNTDAIYSQAIGDPLFLEIDPMDDYNVGLLDELRKAAGTENKTEEELNDYAVQLAEKYISEDLSLKSMKLELSTLKERVSEAPTIAIKDSLNKQIKSLQNRIGVREDKLTDKAEVDAYAPSARDEEKFSEALEKFKSSAVIRVIDSRGDFIAVLKGKNLSAIKNKEDIRFEALRDQIISTENLLDSLLNLQMAQDIQIPGLSVKKIFLGHPNFNFVKNQDGSVGIEFRRLSSSDISKIKDIGFVQNGSLRTRSQVIGVDTTFLNKFIRTAPTDRKIPFIVFDKAGTSVAYPVRVEELPPFDNKEFQDIFNSNAPDVDKAASLNKILASRGIDIKKPGNAFITIGQGNLNEEFFDQKLRQLQSMHYYYDLNAWLDPEVNMNDILSQQVSINIDLSNPLHSPKVQIDLEQIEVEVPIENITEEKQNSVKKSTPGQSVLHSILGEEVKDKAEDELNEDC